MHVVTTPTNKKSRAGEFSCISDFLIIPRGTNGGAGSSCYVSWSEKIWFVYHSWSLVSKSQYRQHAHHHTVSEPSTEILPSQAKLLLRGIFQLHYLLVRLRYVNFSLRIFSLFSDLLPFKFYVELNGAEPTGVNGNRGFSLDFLQIHC